MSGIQKRGRMARAVMYLVVMIALLAHAALARAEVRTIRGSIEAAVEAAQLPPIPDAERDRLIRKHELENHATRVLADVYAARILSGSFDAWSTGRGIDTVGCGIVEANPLLGGSKNSALMILSAKAGVMAAEFLVDRKKATAWVACELDTPGACGQLSNVKKRSVIGTIARLALGGWNTYQHSRHC